MAYPACVGQCVDIKHVVWLLFVSGWPRALGVGRSWRHGEVCEDEDFEKAGWPLAAGRWQRRQRTTWETRDQSAGLWRRNLR